MVVVRIKVGRLYQQIMIFIINEVVKMGAKYTEAQKRASMNFQKKNSQIKITVSKEQCERYRNHAKNRGIDMTKLIISLIEKDIKENG